MAKLTKKYIIYDKNISLQFNSKSQTFDIIFFVIKL
jgi:hypothetical protein